MFVVGSLQIFQNFTVKISNKYEKCNAEWAQKKSKGCLRLKMGKMVKESRKVYLHQKFFRKFRKIFSKFFWSRVKCGARYQLLTLNEQRSTPHQLTLVQARMFGATVTAVIRIARL